MIIELIPRAERDWFAFDISEYVSAHNDKLVVGPEDWVRSFTPCEFSGTGSTYTFKGIGRDLKDLTFELADKGYLIRHPDGWFFWEDGLSVDRNFLIC